MRHNRKFYVDEIYNSREQWYKKKLGKTGEKEVKKQLEVLLMYEYYHISPAYYTDKNGHFVAEYRTLEWAAELVKEKLLISKPKLLKLLFESMSSDYYSHLKKNRFGYYDDRHTKYRIKEWYETHTPIEIAVI